MEIENESNTVSDHNRDLVGALQKGLSVLEILSRAPNSPSGMTLTEVAMEAGLPRAGARRLLLIKQASGFSETDDVEGLTAKGIVDAGFAGMLPEGVELYLAGPRDAATAQAMLATGRVPGVRIAHARICARKAG